MADINSVTEMLRVSGYKVTPQRLAVYAELNKTDDHPNAEMLYKRLQRNYPTMSLATVYKTLDILSNIGLVQAINTGEDSFRYDAKTFDHHHVQCTVCGRIEDVFDIDDSNIMNQVAMAKGYTLSRRQMYFYGVCPQCRAQRKH